MIVQPGEKFGAILRFKNAQGLNQAADSTPTPYVVYVDSSGAANDVTSAWSIAFGSSLSIGGKLVGYPFSATAPSSGYRAIDNVTIGGFVTFNSIVYEAEIVEVSILTPQSVVERTVSVVSRAIDVID